LSLPNNLICLLIDDDEDDQELFALTLEDLHAPITLHTANSGFEGLLQLQSQEIKPDYIFLDLNMPRMGGKECLKLLKEDNDLKNIPVVIFTTSDELQDIDEAIELGALDFITKPALTSELTPLLQDFFHRHHPHLILKP
jgi:CheY-like chemotaxis protein